MQIPAVQPSDRQLADRIVAEGSEEAFRTLYRRYTPYLYQFALRLLGGNRADAEDVVQETWMRGADKLADFRWESSLRSWLGGITLNLCRQHFRRKDRDWTEVGDMDLPGPARNPAGRVDLERALATLPPGYRTVLLLHDLEGYTHEEIAGLLEISSGTSKSQLFHARRTLRRWLEGESSKHKGASRNVS